MVDAKVNTPSPSTAHAAHPFQRMLDAFDGNLDLLKKLAPSVAEHYAGTAAEFRHLAGSPDLARLQSLAHKLNGTWRLYSTGAETALDLPERLESAAAAGETDHAVALAQELAEQVDSTVADLRTLA